MLNERSQSVKLVSTSLWRTIPPVWNCMRSIMHRIAREDYGITSNQFQVLHRIKTENKKTVSDLADCMAVSRPAISRAVDELVKAGLLEREGDPDDRRVIYLKPSDKGEEIIAQIHAKNDLIMQSIFSSLTSAELENLSEAFRILEKVFEKDSIEK